MKYFLTQQQLQEVIMQYSMRKNEFLLDNSCNNEQGNKVTYKHKTIKDYFLTIEPHSCRTNYFIVKHSSDKGYIAYTDLWRIKKDKEVAFISRAIANDKTQIDSDAIDRIEMQENIIQEQQEEIEELKQAGRKIKEELEEKEMFIKNSKQYQKLGRKPKFNEQEIEEIKRRVANKEPIARIAKDFNTTRKTIYKAIGKL